MVWGNLLPKKTIKMMIRAGKKIKDADVLMMGVTFKEDCPDMRNTRVVDIIEELKEYGVNVDVYDPWVDAKEEKKHYRHGFVENPLQAGKEYDAIIVAVGHHQFKQLTMEDYKSLSKNEMVIIDVKGVVPEPSWRL